MYWEHRITNSSEVGVNQYDTHEIVEVHYDDDGKIILVDDVKLIADNKKQLQELVKQILKDIKDAPILPVEQAYAYRNCPEAYDERFKREKKENNNA